MKKGIIISLVALSFFSACNSEDKTVTEQSKKEVKMDMCACIEKGMEMGDEMQKAEGDEAVINEIEKKYAADKEVCEKLAKELEDEMREMTEEEKGKKYEQMLKDCPAMADLY